MGQIDWPSTPFYIKSKVGNGNNVLTAKTTTDNDNNYWPGWDELIPNTYQVWIAQSSGGEGSNLINVGTGMALEYSINKDNAATNPVTLQAIAGMQTNQNWRLATLNEPWCEINTLLDWQQKVNMSHGDPNTNVIIYKWDKSDNEYFEIIEETGQIQIQRFSDE